MRPFQYGLKNMYFFFHPYHTYDANTLAQAQAQYTFPILIFLFPIVFLPTFTIFLFFSLSCSPCLPSTNLEFQFPRSLSYLFSAHTLFTFVSTFSFPIPFHFYRLQISLSLSLTAHFSTSRTCSLNDSPAWLLTDSEQT